ncbi:GNAT family N-acetyltransferase [Fusibacter ferrireducens]|uniref:GNAT family N-acetyltransferase n=1 Tax=Fusibacter ferrireducens TaxID=2785058 RepID=A0ABS0A271_9FIRM|nr:GNAT family N-acetyltransferase [Fusibacter ferrireducens]MBF4695959.1 GNAT family N-acetyltransferase [Fusibacter ferrireducens]
MKAYGENYKKEYRDEHILKNGEVLVIRTPVEDDAEHLIEQMKTVDCETKFLAREPGEFSFTVEQEKKFIKNSLTDDNMLFLLSEVNGCIVGNCSVGRISTQKRFLHRATMGIALKKDYWQMGIGKKMMHACIKWCENNGIEQLELEVVTQNFRALSMYLGLGFEVFGTKKHAMKYSDGTYGDEYHMIYFLKDKL